MGSVIKGTGVYLARSSNNKITSFFVAMKTNLFPSYRLIHAEGEMGFVESE